MARFPIPDPRWEEPALLYPGRKPVGPVEVDWTHSVGRDVLFAFMPVSSETDVIHGPLDKVGTPSVSKGVASFPGSGDYFKYAGPVPERDALTFLVKLKPDTLNYDGIFSDKTHTNYSRTTGVNVNFRGANEFEFRLGEGYRRSSGQTISSGAWNELWGTWETGSVPDVYVNRIAANGTSDGLAAYTKSPYPVTVGAYYSGSGWEFDGDIEYIILVGRKLTEAQLIDLSNNPYQFLIPSG